MDKKKMRVFMGQFMEMTTGAALDRGPSGSAAHRARAAAPERSGMTPDRPLRRWPARSEHKTAKTAPTLVPRSHSDY